MADASKYQQLLAALLPSGEIWPRETDSTLGELLSALAEELARVDLALYTLIEESDPRTSFDCLGDWERVCGLPDECTALTATLSERREAVHAKLTGMGAQTPAYFQGLAAKVGYEVTITEFIPFRAGEGLAGETVRGAAWAHAWQVNAPETTVRTFKAGNSSAGEALRSWGNEKLECVIGQHAPAHTVTLFAYGG